MNQTQKRAINAYAVLTTMGKRVTGKAAYDLFLLKLELKKIVEFQEEEERKLIEKYHADVTQSGVIYIEDKEQRGAFMKEHDALRNLECDVTPVEIEFCDIPNLTMDEIDLLYGFVNFINVR